MKPSKEQMKEACNIVFNYVLENTDFSKNNNNKDLHNLINSVAIKYVSSEIIEKLSEIKMHYEFIAKIVKYENITEKALKNIKRNTNSREVYLAVLRNTSIALDVRKKFLTKTLMNNILKDNYEYYTRGGRADVRYDSIKNKIPKDILDAINSYKFVQDIII